MSDIEIIGRFCLCESVVWIGIAQRVMIILHSKWEHSLRDISKQDVGWQDSSLQLTLTKVYAVCRYTYSSLLWKRVWYWYKFVKQFVIDDSEMQDYINDLRLTAVNKDIASRSISWCYHSCTITQENASAVYSVRKVSYHIRFDASLARQALTLKCSSLC